MKVVNEEILCRLVKDSLDKVEPDDLAYLFATGKSELFVRDHLALALNKYLEFTDQNQFVGREWHSRDLTINNGRTPMVIIEGKSNTHRDAAHTPRRLFSRTNIKKDLVSDAEKALKEFEKAKVPREKAIIFCTNILFSVDIPIEWKSNFDQVGYWADQQRFIKKFGSADAVVKEANTKLLALLKNYGTVGHTRLNVGHFQGMKVSVDYFATRINLQALSQ